MEYSSLWLDIRPLKAPPAFLSAICPAIRTSQGDTAFRELKLGFTFLCGGAAPQRLRTPQPPCLYLRETEARDEGFSLTVQNGIVMLSGGSQGLLYGAFDLLRRLRLGETLESFDSVPRYPLRMLDHWDNADGSIERGYSGNSFFLKNGELLVNERTQEYARLLCSCGLNAACINNVNVRGDAVRLLTPRYRAKLRALSEQFSAYGVSLWLSVSFAAPMELGGLSSADPLDPTVADWWRQTAEELYAAVPLLGGFLIKADSEGRPGPFTYGRSHADGANMLARALRPFGGSVLWRCFVYNSSQDWRDLETDRARAQCDHFAPLDGQFDNNVYLQIKNGPVDFQVREPVSPLLGHLNRTNSILEFQLAQEYTGQQRHVCYLIPMYKEVLDFPLTLPEDGNTVADRIQAVTAVSNTGSDYNWTGHDLAAANLYGFGRLSWNPSLDAETLVREWCCLTYGSEPQVIAAVSMILMSSWPVYESYTVPLGLGWMCAPGHHYGPSPEGYEYDRWGTYHRATCREIGVERGPDGTGYTEQYLSPWNEIYADPATCPEELLLFFHRLPYDHRLRSGKTLIQHVYDSHFAGYAAAEQMAELWQCLEGRIPEDAYARVSERFREQLRSARDWRDVINSWFYRRTLLPDEQGRPIY